MSHDHLVNPELIAMAKAANAGQMNRFAKKAFVPGDAAAGGGAPPPGGDPAMAGGAPPMDPAMAGGAPPMDPAMAGGGGDPLAALGPMIQQAVQEAMAANGGGGGGGGEGGGIKPKIDVNVEMMQIKKMLAHIMDGLQIPMPASQMVATSDDLNQMAANPGADPAAAGGAPGGGAIQPIEPMQAAAPGGEKVGHAFNNGIPFGTQPSSADQIESLGSVASQVAGLLRSRGAL